MIGDIPIPQRFWNVPNRFNQPIAVVMTGRSRGMQQVITEKQARQITGGRKPLIPVEYEQACKALEACATIDEAKYWSDKSDALAAWAKIYHSKSAEIEARKLKLHAFRRMGILAAELRPQECKRRSDGKIIGKKDGPASLLREKGLDGGKEFAATKLSRLPEASFNAFLEKPNIPSPMAVLRSSNTDAGAIVKSANSFRTFCRKMKPHALAAEINTAAQRALFRELLEWLDELDRHLSK